MPTNKRPRKPRAHRQATIPVTIRHGADDERTLQLVPHAELVKLREGMGDECGWHTIACRVNIGATLARQNQIDDTVMCQALAALIDIADRFGRTQRWGGSHGELNAIGDALNATDVMQLGMTKRQLRSAINHVMAVATV
jgi:hypothetical protein